jgi:hypothetical protein
MRRLAWTSSPTELRVGDTVPDRAIRFQQALFNSPVKMLN